MVLRMRLEANGWSPFEHRLAVVGMFIFPRNTNIQI